MLLNKSLVGALCASFCLAALCGADDHSSHGVPSSTAVAALALTDTAGKRQRLDQYRDHIVVLNFWATWCIPCRDEMPLLVRFQERYGAAGVQVIGAAADARNRVRHVLNFTRQMNMNFPMWLGATTADMQGMGLGETLPATAILDRGGQIVGRIRGPVNGGELDESIRWLLSDRTTPRPASLSVAEPEVRLSPEELVRQHPHHAGAHASDGHHHIATVMEGVALVPT